MFCCSFTHLLSNISRDKQFLLNKSFHTAAFFSQTLLDLNISGWASSKKLKLELYDESLYYSRRCIFLFQGIPSLLFPCHCLVIGQPCIRRQTRPNVNVIVLDNAIIDRFWRHDDPREVTRLTDMTFIASRGFDTSQPFRIRPPAPNRCSFSFWPRMLLTFAVRDYSSDWRNFLYFL